MKDWLEIVRLYERDNLYLAEAAQMLMRNVSYEVPSFKKQIQKIEQTEHVSYFNRLAESNRFNKKRRLQEFEKKEADYKKSENIARSEFNAVCKQLDIPGSKIKRELAERIVELPEIYEAVVRKTKTLENVVEFYSAFVEFTLGHGHAGGSVPMIKYVIGKKKIDYHIYDRRLNIF